jgi:polyferredoxin
VLAEDGVGRTVGFWDAWKLPKVWIAAVVAGIGLILLMAGKVTKRVRLMIMGLAFFLWGVAPALPLGDFARGMGLHPSPMCLIGRPIQFLVLGREVPIVFVSLVVFVALLSVIGTKLFCGWTCPIGALQELTHAVPLPGKRRIRVPFAVSNTVRIVVFSGFIGVLFGFRYYIYDAMNPFHFLHWDFDTFSLVIVGVVVIAGLLLYRPFCYFLCPLGLLSWPLEQVALTRIRLDKSKCTDCRRCVKEGPCPAVDPILRGKRIRPDCHACGECVRICPEGALSFK